MNVGFQGGMTEECKVSIERKVCSVGGSDGLELAVAVRNSKS